MFSRSLVRVVCDYLVYATATPARRPELLHTFALKSKWDFPRALAVGHNEKLWVSGTGYADTAFVQVLNDDGKFLHDAAKGALQNPYGVAFAANGEAYIVDQNAKCIVVCKPDGSVFRKIHAQFDNPRFCHIDNKQGILFVADGSRVFVLKLDGSIVREFGSFGRDDGQLADATGVTVNTETRELAVSDRDRVQVCCCCSRALLSLEL